MTGHGVKGYEKGCRCGICTAANADKQARRRAKNAAATGGRLPAKVAAEFSQSLSGGRGTPTLTITQGSRNVPPGYAGGTGPCVYPPKPGKRRRAP